MFKAIRLALPGAALLFLLGGCSDAETPEQTVASGDPSPLIQYIPADTPYVAANQEPIPEAVMDKMWSSAEPVLTFAQTQLAEGLKKLEGKTLDDDERVLQAVLRELDGKLSRSGLNSIGLDFRYFAVYTDGVLPTVRISLSDGNAFQAALDRIEAASGSEFIAQEAAGQRFYDIGDDTVRILVSPQVDQLIITLTPTDIRQTGVDAITGVSRPERDVSERLSQVNQAYGLLPSGTVIIDAVALFDRMIDENSPAARSLFAELQTRMTPTCHSEIRDLLETAPRLVSGNTVLSTSEMEQLMVLELEPGLASDLQAIVTPMRGLVPMDQGSMYFAFAMNVMEMKRIAAERTAARVVQPFQCEKFANLNDQLQRSQARLAQPLPPFVGNLKGLRVLVEDFELAGGQPKASGMAMVGMDNPQLILGMAQAFVPELAQLQIDMDGTPVAVPESLVQGQAENPHIAMMPHGIAFSVGSGQERELQAFLEAEPPIAPVPLVAFSYDVARLQELQQRMLDQSSAYTSLSPEEEQSRQAVADMQQALRDYYDVFGRITGQVLITNRGIEIIGRTTLN
ncbi:MAG: hypothetical protein R3200_06930 [Xanthomonadales bacterium]|nr:hypothetical protein [Xanthomonadales bacterium]